MQSSIDSSKGIEDRRRLGQFATPIQLAQEIISFGLALQDEKKISFLEPAIGTGAFYSALLSELGKHSKTLAKATGIELDRDFCIAARDLWGDTGIDLINEDFTRMEPIGRANLLVCNPPYVRHHYIERKDKERLAATAREETGLSPSGLSGLYCYFILCAHKWLEPNAICGWLVPSEFMDVNYGKVLKEYLLDKVHLLRIHRYDPSGRKFDDALVSSCVVWFKNEAPPDDYDIEFSYGGTHERPAISRRIGKNDLKGLEKWTRFPEKGDLALRQAHSPRVPTLGDFFAIKRGIATGDNGFFILSREQIEALGLDMGFFSPVLPSPRHLGCDEVFRDDDGYPLMDMQYFLLDCRLSENELKAHHPDIWGYLDSGRDSTARKYLCRNRKVWYFQENRAATPFLCSYMGRGKGENPIPFRFILNHSSAIATNSYLMLYPRAPLREAISSSPDMLDRIWGILKSIGPEELECEGRVYGGGLRKIEPKELSRVRCPDLARMLDISHREGKPFCSAPRRPH